MMVRQTLLILVLTTLAGCHRPYAAFERCSTVIPAASRQAVVVDRDGDSPTGVGIRLYEREENGWRPVSMTIPAVAGVNGLAPMGAKREGDGRTPSGVFALERGFGYFPLKTFIPYLVLTPEMIWVDDPRSPLYNRLVDRKDGEGLSFEEMRRSDHLYKYGLVIEYNTKPIVPGAGSAIFFHIWRDSATATTGCVAMEEADMVRLLTWLDPARQPVAVIGEGCGN